MWHWTVPSGGGLRNGVFDAPGRPQAVGTAAGVLSLPCRVRRHSPSGTPALLILVDTAHRGQPPEACHQARLFQDTPEGPDRCLQQIQAMGGPPGPGFLQRGPVWV